MIPLLKQIDRYPESLVRRIPEDHNQRPLAHISLSITDSTGKVTAPISFDDER